ncbi:cation channel sperm-associated protein 3-like [Gordionus sp. m RMFG-2023]|uniref:cation channel sperm-associated protein 3-like n=1 Tax=Gordionus sp. m RMFG-2023 TaxID=3053472 RepID=UPI0031FC24A3
MSTTNGGVRYLCKSILESSIFTNGIMFLVLLNAVSLSLEADVFIRKPYNDIFMIVNEIFYGLFLTEFLLKIYVLRLKYWKSFYNIVDFCILCGFAVQNMINILYPIQFGTVAQISAFIRILKTLRTLRLITLIKELQVLMDALLDSLAKFVIYVIIFIFLVIFLFALLGYYLFGHMVNKEGYWKNLWEALLSILTYLTAEGWTDIQSELDATSPGLGRFFSVTALVVGNFVLMNIFTGIIVMNISEALSSFKDEKEIVNEKLKAKKKEILFAKYQREITKIQNTLLNHQILICLHIGETRASRVKIVIAPKDNDRIRSCKNTY